MNDDRDPALVALFADQATPPDADGFVAAVEARVARAQRARSLQRAAVAVAALGAAWWAAPYLVAASVTAGEQFGSLVASPAGWGVSLLVAAWVWRRARG